jgi:hypothetical protein
MMRQSKNRKNEDMIVERHENIKNTENIKM